MSTPLGMGAVVGRISSALARSCADRALRLSTQLWGDRRYSDLGKHAIAADDAAFLAEDAVRRGRHHEVREHARRAREQYLMVRRLVEAGHTGPS